MDSELVRGLRGAGSTEHLGSFRLAEEKGLAPKTGLVG